MEQIRLDPQPPFFVKRETKPAVTAGDIFATLLDIKLKDGTNVRPANDADATAARPENPGRGHRTPPTGAKRSHLPTHADRLPEARESLRLKAMQAAQRDRVDLEDRREGLAKNSLEGEPLGCGGPASLRAETGSSASETDQMPDQTATDAENQGGSSSGGTGDNPPDADLTDPATAVMAAAPVPATLPLAGEVAIDDDAAVPGVPAPAAISPDEANAMAQAALAAATALPVGTFETAGSADAAEENAPGPAGSAMNSGGDVPLVGVSDGVAPQALSEPGQEQAIPIASTVAAESDAAGAVFRTSVATSKGKAQTASPGAAAPHAQTHQPDQPAPPRAATGPQDGLAGASMGAEDRGTGTGPGVAGAFEDADQSGLGGWPLHLAQGASGRRADFIANLRQHLQNLPAHEQVAVHIQRAVTDRLSKITVELSPVELGRIQVKLKIDEENRVVATIAVERAGTLELLQKDARALERALQEAGLKTDSSSLSFTLHGGEADESGQNWAFGGPGGTARTGDGAATVADAKDLARPSVIVTADGLVDVEV